MKQIKHRPSSIKTGAMFLAATAVLAFSSQGAFAQSNDFFSSTQSTDLRATAASPAAPGFDPCRGGTAGGGSGNSASSCTGAGANKPLLDPSNLGDSVSNTAGLFARLGPGAVTDNMFGIIEHPANPLQCGGAGAIAGGNALNCGDGKVDETSQGQVIPQVGAILSSFMATNTPIDVDSGPASGTGSGAHMHSRVENGFVWNPTTTNNVAIPVNLVGLPATIATAPTAKTCDAAATNGPNGTSTVCGQFFMIQDTALSDTTNQLVHLAASWNTKVDNTNSGNLLGGPVLTWESHIVQSEFTGGGTFDQTLQGSFTYNGTPPGTGVNPPPFPPTQYPNGQSF